jgi:hypothetical protein
LDAKLAAGCFPDSRRLLAARARVLVSRVARQTLARDWEHLLEVARTRPVTVDCRAPMCRDRVLAAEPDIQQLLVALRVPLPVPVRGVAMASHLLTYGTGPVYNCRSAVNLCAALHEAIGRMDPFG